MSPRLLAALLAGACVAAAAPAGAAGAGEGPRASAASPPRVVSLNPSLSAILLAIGAGDSLVGVDEYSARQQPALRSLPVVGGLFNASLESIVALRPDLVVLVPSAQQRDLRERLEGLGIEVLSLPNIELEALLASIERLGERVGRGQAARERVAEIRADWARVANEPRQAPPLRALLVIQRDPLYVVGGGSFLDAMLRAAGATNAAGSFAEPYPRVSLEWLIAAAPQVILDSSEDATPARDYWARWPSLPAVAADRVMALPAVDVTLPGPHPERGLRIVAETLRAAETR